MVLGFLFDAFVNGGLLMRISLATFVGVFAIILVYLTFLGLYLGKLKQNKDELFQLITDEELEQTNILADYKLIEEEEQVFFTDKGVALRDSTNLRMILYDDILHNEMNKILDRSLNQTELPKKIKIPLQTPIKIKRLYGGQSLSIPLPLDEDKKRIILTNLRKIISNYEE